MAEPTTQSQPARPASAGMVGFSAGVLISLGASSSSVLDSVLGDEDMIFFRGSCLVREQVRGKTVNPKKRKEGRKS